MAAQNERRISHMKRFLALLLGALMVLSLLTACGGKQDKTDGDETIQSSRP